MAPNTGASATSTRLAMELAMPRRRLLSVASAPALKPSPRAAAYSKPVAIEQEMHRADSLALKQGCPHRRTCMGETARLPARGVNYDRPSLTLAADCRYSGIERPSSTPRRLNRAPLLTLVFFAGVPRPRLQRAPVEIVRLGEQYHALAFVRIRNADCGMLRLRLQPGRQHLHRCQRHHFAADLGKASGASLDPEKPFVIDADDVAGIVPTCAARACRRLQLAGPVGT